MPMKYEDFELPEFIKPDAKVIDYGFNGWLLIPLTIFIAGMIALALIFGKRLISDVSDRRGRAAQQPNRPRAPVNRPSPTQAPQPAEPETAGGETPAVATDSNNANEADSTDSEEDSEAQTHLNSLLDRANREGKKVGKKKLRKLEEKAERRAAHESFQREIADRKEQRAREEEERKAEAELQKKQAAEQAASEKAAQEERERLEQEEYMKLKMEFSIEGSGEDASELLDSENESALKQFVDLIKSRKVVELDWLAARYRLRTAELVDRMRTLLAAGALSGVFDERGKFLYISEEEYVRAAELVRSLGRVSLSELTRRLSKVVEVAPAQSACDNEPSVPLDLDYDEPAAAATSHAQQPD